MAKQTDDPKILERKFAEDRERLAKLQNEIQKAQQKAKPVPLELDHPAGGGTF